MLEVNGPAMLVFDGNSMPEEAAETVYGIWTGQAATLRLNLSRDPGARPAAVRPPQGFDLRFARVISLCCSVKPTFAKMRPFLLRTHFRDNAGVQRRATAPERLVHPKTCD